MKRLVTWAWLDTIGGDVEDVVADDEDDDEDEDEEVEEVELDE